MTLAETLTYEQLASALYLKGEIDGFEKVTDKTKWREPVMADKLGHKAHTKISAGAGKDEYGSDAIDLNTGRYAEYKSQAVKEYDYIYSGKNDDVLKFDLNFNLAF